MAKYDILKILRLILLYVGLILLMVHCKYYQSLILMIIGIIIHRTWCYMLHPIIYNTQ